MSVKKISFLFLLTTLAIWAHHCICIRAKLGACIRVKLSSLMLDYRPIIILALILSHTACLKPTIGVSIGLALIHSLPSQLILAIGTDHVSYNF